jgi:outer membrane protein OmpA-like peptidoglycan-associated protein
LRHLREALPASVVADRMTALPTGLDEARADIKVLQDELARARADGAKAEAALAERLAGIEAALKQASADTQSGLGGLRAALDQAETARRAGLEALAAELGGELRGEIARAVAPSPRAHLAAWIGTNALFFTKDTDYRNPQAAAAALDELTELIKATDVLVRVVGYTDEKGGEERNTPLSQARAEKVVAELAARGIPAARLVAVGRRNVADLSPFVGESSPNRRVEFEIGFEGEGGP